MVDMTAVDHAPTVPSRVLATMAATLALVTTLQGTPASVGVALLGASTLALGAFTGSRAALDGGAGLLFLGVVIAAAFTTQPVIPLLGGVATVVAWDVGDTGISLGRQLGTAARTSRVEMVNAGASVGVGLAAVTISTAVFTFAAGNQPLPALVLLLFAAVVLTATLRD
jgi:hypothetical protein